VDAQPVPPTKTSGESAPRPPVDTPRRALSAAERERTGATPSSAPAEADGLALAGVQAASLGDGGRGVISAGSLAASCVHHVVGASASARACRGDVEFVSADPADSLVLASAARAVSAGRGKAVLHRLPRALADRVTSLPSAPSAHSQDPLAALTEAGGSAVSVEGEGTAALIAVGAEVPRARRLAAQLRSAGTPCRVVIVRCVQPFPASLVTEALDGVDPERLVVLDESVRPGRLAGCVKLTRGEAPATIAPNTSAPAWLAEAMDQGMAPAEGERHWQATPAGEWARAVLFGAASELGVSGPAGSGGRVSERSGALDLCWASSGDSVGVFAHPSSIGSLEGVAVALVCSCSPAQLLAAAGEAVSATVRAGAQVWCFQGADASAASSALAAVLAGASLPAGVEAVTVAAVDAASAPREVDFRATPQGLQCPAGASTRDLSPWFAFHRSGPDASQAPPPSVVSLAATVARQSLSAKPLWPAVVAADGAVRSWSDAVQDAPSSAAETLLAVPGRLAARVGKTADPGAPVGPCLASAARSLAVAMAGSDSAQTRLEADADALGAALSGTVEPLRPETPLRWTVSAMLRARRSDRADLTQRVSGLADRLRERLLLERLDSEEGRSASAVGASLGGAGHFFNSAALATALPTPGHEPLEPAQKARLEQSLSVLDAWLATEPRVQIVSENAVELDGVDVSVHPDPCGAAVGLFEGLAAASVEVARALRLVSDELDFVRTPRVGPGLAGLDWQGLRADELGLLPDVLVLTGGAALRAGGIGALSSLLRSSRPVRVLALDAEDSDEACDLSRHHADLGLLGVAHREAAVLQSSLADPVAFADGLAAVLSSWRPALVVARRIDPDSGTAAALDAELARRSRAWPELSWVPDAGLSWADRLTLAGNPDVADAWPVCRVDAKGGAGSEGIDAPCTFADAVAGGTTFGSHLRALPPDAWDDAALLPLDEFVKGFDPSRPRKQLPWIWTLDGPNTLGRAVVSRALALAGRDRARAWKQLQELAGYGDVHAERAAAQATTEAEAAAQATVAALEAAHATTLASIAEDAVGAAMDRLATSLLGLEGAIDPAALTARPSAPSAPAATPAAAAEPEAAPAAAEEPEDDDVIIEEAYIDAFLCTTCNECTNINPRMFQYNADKQAEIVDVAAGTFEEMVKAAEACPSKCIHPGAPRPGDASATDDMVARAAVFA
jgi:ferredoxin